MWPRETNSYIHESKMFSVLLSSLPTPRCARLAVASLARQAARPIVRNYVAQMRCETDEGANRPPTE